ncbi:hypothetical protein PG988_015926 [Apiospora saccharicola]
MADPKDSLKAFQECFQIAARGALGNKVAQSKQVIQQGRAVIQTQFEMIREEMRSFRARCASCWSSAAIRERRRSGPRRF